MVLRMLLCALLCWASVADAETFMSRAMAVLDGDTLLVQHGDRTLSVRLADIDAPEKAQPGGAAAHNSLSELVNGKQLEITSVSMDQYGRMVAKIKVDFLDVNAEQVRRGMAWEYSLHHSNKDMVALQKAAQAAKRGLWAKPNPIPPSDWRKAHPLVPKASTNGQTCGKKRYCSQMSNCAEARFYLTQCGLKRLDANGDGVPCETLCVGQ